MIVAVDCETTGKDFHHGTLPFFVTICNSDGTQEWVEWDVDPLTRKVLAPDSDLQWIVKKLDAADKLVLQNPKFDFHALTALGLNMAKYWPKVEDTLMAGHLLASNHPHDLTSMALEYLGKDIEPYELKLREACLEARKMAPDGWRTAKESLPEMPSASGKVWKNDYWLPRAVAKFKKLTQDRCTVVNCKKEPFDVMIDRTTKWGNPFKIGRDGNRAEVIAKYAKWIVGQPKLLASIGELDGKIFGCHCNPLPCHGDVLKTILEGLAHPWWTVLADYSNVDSAITLALYDVMIEELRRRGLYKIYRERLKILPVIFDMECRGITYSDERLKAKYSEFKESSDRAGRVLVNIAKSLDFDLVLPKSGNNKSLTTFVFDVLKIPPTKLSKKTSKPALDKNVIEYYAFALPEGSKAKTFISRLQKKRKWDTALSFMESYRSFGVAYEGTTKKLFSSLNPTATNTLRAGSEQPNQQNISKSGDYSLRYLFGPTPGREWWSIDFENIELRIPAYEANERAMIELFERPNDPPYFGSNHLLFSHILHPELFEACRSFEMTGPNGGGMIDGRVFKKKYASTWYQWTKNGDFAVQYGAVAESGTADAAYHVPGGQHKIESHLTNIKALSVRMIQHAEKTGYVETLPDKEVDASRGYPLLCTRSSWGKILPTVPLSYHVQGTAMWCTNKAMIRCDNQLKKWRKEKFDGFITMQVHDEMVFDFPAGGKKNLDRVNRMRELMERSGEDIGVPLKASVSYHPENWGEEVKLV